MPSGTRHDYSPVGHGGKSWVSSVGGLPPMIRDVAHALVRSGHDESSAIELAVGAVKRWASGQGKVHPDTRAKAAAAVAQWEAMKVASHAKSAVKASGGKRDDMGVVTESSSAGALLPVGPSKAESARITARMSPHGFRGKDLASCSVCGQPVTDAVHSMTPKRSAVDEISTLLGREVGARSKNLPKDAKRAAHAATFQADATSIEGPIHDAVVTVFADQAKATLSRLLGKRGKQMMRAAGDGTDDETPEPVNPAQIFDLAFWIQRLEQALQPSLSSVAPIARNRVQTQIGTSAMGVDDASSLGALRTVLNDRVKRLADEVNQTTYDALAKALHEGIANGEGIPDLAKRVQGVFDDASNARATMIARTESVGALNQASHVYASNLPKDVVGGKQWLCVAAGTRVASANPREIVERRRMEGYMTSLRTRGGRVLSVTPNHPILTTRGWVAADLLSEGDNLICYGGEDAVRMDGGPPLGDGDRRRPDVQYAPPKVDEVFRAATLDRSSSRMVATVPDLYSDPINCEVEVISLHGDLATDLQTPLGQPSGEGLFVLSDIQLTSLVESASLRHELVGSGVLSAVPPSGGCPLHGSDALTLGITGSSQGSRSREIADRDASLAQDLANGEDGASHALGDDDCRVPALVGTDDGLGVEVDASGFRSEHLSSPSLLRGSRVVGEAQAGGTSSATHDATLTETALDSHLADADSLGDFDATLTGEITLDELIDIETSWVSTGHEVYDLVTKEGWFLAEGIVVHNSHHDSRTRPTHKAADGETRTIEAPFKVGESAMQFPGDPTAPPSETIGCRCCLAYIPAMKAADQALGVAA